MKEAENKLYFIHLKLVITRNTMIIPIERILKGTISSYSPFVEKLWCTYST